MSTESNPNTGILEGRSCPKCKSLGPFRVKAVSMFEVWDDGCDGFGDVEFVEGRDSLWICRACGHSGNGTDFDEGVVAKADCRHDEVYNARP